MPPNAPTLQAVTSLLQSIFLQRVGDVPFTYHVPRRSAFSFSLQLVSRIVLSITPTAGVYSAISAGSQLTSPVLFLHRPWQLDRRRVPGNVTALACHKGFDEVLTVGYNTALAERLGMHLSTSICLQGYKGDPDRRIGIVGSVATPYGALLRTIEREFGSLEGTFPTEYDEEASQIKALAIMNAFHPEEVQRVGEALWLQAAIDSVDDCAGVVYLTGAVRQEGLEAALQRRMRVVCVGHRTCEEWGIRYLAQVLRAEFPAVDVVEVLEDEEIAKKELQMDESGT